MIRQMAIEKLVENTHFFFILLEPTEVSTDLPRFGLTCFHSIAISDEKISYTKSTSGAVLSVYGFGVSVCFSIHI